MSNLPIEILDHVFRHLSLHDLSIIMQTSRLFYNISAPILYDSIPSLPLARSNSCLSSLCNNEFTVSLVRSLTIDWRRHVIHDCVTQFGSTADLLNECLRRLHRLTALTLILDHAYVCGQTFSGCSFTLSSLTTSFYCDSDFIAFLESQPNIVTLDLTCQERPPPFTINPSALPMLKSFSSNYVSPDFLGEFLRGRPVEQVDLASCFVLNLSVLDMLSLSTRPIKRLTICEVDGSAQDVVQALRTRAPHVEDLYMGFFKKQVMSDFFDAIPSILPEFPSLKTVRALVIKYELVVIGNEQEILRHWRASRTTLQGAALPPKWDRAIFSAKICVGYIVGSSFVASEHEF